eukprot:scaffold178922_cov28-Tisochrysis_lutea.AAC.1
MARASESTAVGVGGMTEGEEGEERHHADIEHRQVTVRYRHKHKRQLDSQRGTPLPRHRLGSDQFGRSHPGNQRGAVTLNETGRSAR